MATVVGAAGGSAGARVAKSEQTEWLVEQALASFVRPSRSRSDAISSEPTVDTTTTGDPSDNPPPSEPTVDTTTTGDPSDNPPPSEPTVDSTTADNQTYTSPLIF